MNTSRLTLVAACLVLMLQSAAKSEEETVDPQVRAQLTALVNAWIDAEVNDDRAGLEAILHEDFLSTFASGATLDRDAYIDVIVDLDLSPFTVSNESMRQFGDTVVVVDVSDDGTTKFTWIAINRDGAWKVIAQTFSRIESATAE